MQKYIEFKLSILDILSKTYPYIKTTFEEFKFSWKKFTVATITSTLILGALTPSYITYAENEDVILMECLKTAILTEQDVDGVPIEVGDEVVEMDSCRVSLGDEKFETIQKGTKALRKLIGLLKTQEMKIHKTNDSDSYDVYVDATDVWHAINSEILTCILYEDEEDKQRCIFSEAEAELSEEEINKEGASQSQFDEKIEVYRSEICNAGTIDWDNPNHWNVELLLQCYFPDINNWQIVGQDNNDRIKELKAIRDYTKTTHKSWGRVLTLNEELELDFRENQASDLEEISYTEVVNQELKSKITNIDSIDNSYLKNARYFYEISQYLQAEIIKQAGIVNNTIGVSDIPLWTAMDNWESNKLTNANGTIISLEYKNEESSIVNIIDAISNDIGNTSSVLSNLYTKDGSKSYSILPYQQRSAQFIGDSIKRILANSLVAEGF